MEFVLPYACYAPVGPAGVGGADGPDPDIAGLVNTMRRSPGRVECALTHRFTPGMYIREVFVPKGTYLVTRVHRTEHPFVVSKGRIMVWSPDGGVKTIEAPYTGVTRPGTVRMAIAIEDTIWTTFHATDKTDVAEIEQEFTDDPCDVLEYKGIKCLS
jgi:hypothetical protein